MEGQISNDTFKNQYPEHKNTCNHAVTRRGNTVNYWMQHSDGSWTNYDCKTKQTVKL